MGSSLLCYRCDSTLQNAKSALLCSDFDYSDRFIVQCSNSTFCMKKDYTVNLKGKIIYKTNRINVRYLKILVPINGTVRGCANQVYETMQFVDNTWHSKTIVEEPYSEKCVPLDDKGFRTSQTTYCFCKGDLCNNSMRATTKNSAVITLLLLLLYVYM